MNKKRCYLIPLFLFCIFFFTACGSEEAVKTDKDLADIEVYDPQSFNGDMAFADAENYKMKARISDTSILKDWQGKDYEHSWYFSDVLTDEEYNNLYSMLSVSSWVETTDSSVDNAQEPMIQVYSEPHKDMIREIILYPKDTAIITEKHSDKETSTEYRMPEGYFQQMQQYVTEFRESKLEKIADAPQDFLKELLSLKYTLRWNVDYDAAKWYQGEEYLSNSYVCLGTEAMAKEVLTAFGNIDAWEALPPAEYSHRYLESRWPNVSIGGSPYYINIYTGKSGGTYIEVPEYLVFFSSNRDIAEDILTVIDKYPDQWRIFLNQE